MYKLRRLREVRKALSTSVTLQCVLATVVSAVDYCNSLVFGVPDYLMSKIQTILKVAARLIYRQDRRASITPTMKDRLHWLQARERVIFKRCLIIHGIITGQSSPKYLERLLTPACDTTRRSTLRSASSLDLAVPKPLKITTLGDRAFSRGGPLLWNTYPPEIRRIKARPIFKNRLKSHLFRESYLLQSALVFGYTMLTALYK